MWRKLIGRRKVSKDGAYDAFCKEYILTSVVLGTGSYAEVRMAKKKKTNETVAVKIVDKTNLTSREVRGLQKEVEILKTVNHKNVVKLYDYYEEEQIMYVVMEYVGGGELFDRVVKNDPPFSENDVRRIIKTLADALHHCKQHGIIHRDIKPQNLLLTAEEFGGELKLADFNLSIQLDPESIEFNVVQTMCGTPNYVAPEVLSGKPYDFKCDIWSLGVICFVVLSGGCLPFFVEEDGEIGKQKLLRKVRKGKWGFYPRDAWESVSDDAKDFLRKVMERHPEKRIDYQGIMEHPWIADDSKFYGNAIDMTAIQRDEYFRKMNVANITLTAAKKFEGMMFESIKEVEKKVEEQEEVKVSENNLLDSLNVSERSEDDLFGGM